MIAALPWWWKVIGGGAVLVVILLAEQSYESHLIAKGDGAGAARVHAEWKASEAAIEANARREAAADAARARAETAALQSKFAQLAERQQKDRVDHENEKRIAVAAALAGDVRLSVTTAGGAGNPLHEVGADEGSGSRAGPPAEARANLLPATASAILGIAGDYGQLVRDYNSLLGRFDTARATCNSE
ncbi:hypothetical protein GTP55_25735 [Duganella sp. FT109W]|uniref:DUF2514 family protein n=1 Tax=Duganella margarita TaxID=2692170 RepID=A0ABW9WPH9_9BURK|nr:hypothetical protein [Duganella margarita]MYN42750.1 hypothetical protein [Duganella margarita]